MIVLLVNLTFNLCSDILRFSPRSVDL